MEETDCLLSARCPHCRRTVLMEGDGARRGTVLECPWPDCREQLGIRGSDLIPLQSLLGDVLGNI